MSGEESRGKCPGKSPEGNVRVYGEESGGICPGESPDTLPTKYQSMALNNSITHSMHVALDFANSQNDNNVDV